ncbi:hypothetical protein WICPIJ_000300 [Wickerhamomyces pijperi]|uniref:Enolase-phosphatase E1 n=1 Tax=Wickerhamomyces pijperi TaxID=599730 RepID=A0A9P8TS34_WICPI|nr:hypothetical protein WICPIJ_000300 [Wickerhamomyces pijperi]
MSSISFDITIKAVILDIEGTVAPITFVKDVLFPYFLRAIPDTLSPLTYPIQSSSTNTIEAILSNFPSEVTESKESTFKHIEYLVKNDIKDSTLKSLQGFVWTAGYESGEIKAPLYDDAIAALHRWNEEGKKIFIYSSGSVKAQKLLFQYVNVNDKSVDFNGLLSGYFDITTSGYKFETTSYVNIIKDIQFSPEESLFLSDNVKEVSAALEAGLNSLIVVREGNAPLSEEDLKVSKTITSFDQISI